MPRLSSLADHALWYASLGIYVFPCNWPTPEGKAPCSCGEEECGSVGKHPRIQNGLNAASIDSKVIERWWRRWPDANIGLRTGEISGIVVVDVDPKAGGTNSMLLLIEKHGALPSGLLRVRTGSGGWHLYYKWPADGEVRNSASRVGPGIDVRGNGGYVIAPPSLHSCGDRYEFLSTDGLPQEIPEWLMELMKKPPPPPRRERPAGVSGNATGWAKAALKGECKKMREAADGQRNHTLNACAFSLGQIVGGGSLSVEEVEDALLEAALDAGLSEFEIWRTMESGMRAGEQQPRYPTK